MAVNDIMTNSGGTWYLHPDGKYYSVPYGGWENYTGPMPKAPVPVPTTQKYPTYRPPGTLTWEGLVQNAMPGRESVESFHAAAQSILGVNKPLDAEGARFAGQLTENADSAAAGLYREWLLAGSSKPRFDLDAKDEANDILRKYQNGTLTLAQANEALKAIGWASIIDRSRGTAAETGETPTPTAGEVTPTTAGGTSTRTGTSAQDILKDFFRLALQGEPERAFRQFFQGFGAPGGGTLSSRAMGFLGAPAVEGFFLSPFLQPQHFTGANPLETLGGFTMPKFLAGFDGGRNLPTPRDVRGGLRAASSLFGQKGNPAQQAIADILNRPDSNQAVFDMISNPIVGRSGSLFANAIQGFLNRGFAQFQEEDPSKSFLREIMAGRGGSAFGGMAF